MSCTSYIIAMMYAASLNSVGVAPLCGGVPSSLEVLLPLIAVIVWADYGLMVSLAFATHMLVLAARKGAFIVVPEATWFP